MGEQEANEMRESFRKAGLNERQIEELIANHDRPKEMRIVGSGADMVSHPAHYNKDDVETIEKMIRIWGREQVAIWCKITAFKYRERAGYKADDIEQDIHKALWYEEKYNELIKTK